MKRLNTAGSHVLAIALIVLALGVVGFVGYTVASRNSKPAESATTQKGDSSSSAINDEQDLSSTSKSLDDSSGDLDSSVDASSLDSDMNDLL